MLWNTKLNKLDVIFSPYSLIRNWRKDVSTQMLNAHENIQFSGSLPPCSMILFHLGNFKLPYHYLSMERKNNPNKGHSPSCASCRLCVCYPVLNYPTLSSSNYKEVDNSCF